MEIGKLGYLQQNSSAVKSYVARSTAGSDRESSAGSRAGRVTKNIGDDNRAEKGAIIQYEMQSIFLNAKICTLHFTASKPKREGIPCNMNETAGQSAEGNATTRNANVIPDSGNNEIGIITQN